MRKLLVDANHLAGRCWATLGEMMTTDGRHSGVVHGFLRGLQHVQRVHRIDTPEVLICWDGGHSTRRKELYPEYKAGRHPKDPTPDEQILRQEYRNQLAALHHGLQVSGYRQIMVAGVEADDLLGIFTEHQISEGHVVYIYGGDRDFFQLVRPSLFIIDPGLKENNGIRDEKNVLNYWKLPSTAHALLYRAICGDTSDGITGIFGVGDVGARRICKFVDFAEDGQIVRIRSTEATDAKDQKVLSKFLANLDIIARNLVLMKIPRIWEESDYSETQKDSAIFQYEQATESDDLKYASFLMKWELRSILGVE